MEFKTEAQRASYERIARWMKELFGEFAEHDSGAPMFSIVVGSALTQVFVSAWNDDDAVITVRSYVVSDVEVTNELAIFLLEQNSRMRFGAFGLDEDHDIFFQHNIVGSTCDKNELKASVLAVANTADDFDDEIVSRFGGLRAVDRGW